MGVATDTALRKSRLETAWGRPMRALELPKFLGQQFRKWGRADLLERYPITASHFPHTGQSSRRSVATNRLRRRGSARRRSSGRGGRYG